MSELPREIVDIAVLRLNANVKKICTCEQTRIEVDTVNRLIYCQQCGAVLDPFDALLRLARDRKHFHDEVERLLEQRKEILNYKPWLVEIKNIEHQYRGHKYLPCCPNCAKPFYLGELRTWVNRELVEQSQRRTRATDRR